jgi:hypothetical protein
MKPSRPRPKRKKKEPPRRFGHWDLDEHGQPYYLGMKPEAMMHCAIRYGRGDYHLHRTEKDGRWVSTVFLWINHQWGDGPPILFETGARCGGKIVICERYSTRQEADAGHIKWCKTYLE